MLLAGDAAHTHSSAFAQGMNTGVHDATNLIWKLSGAVKGWYCPEVLESYAVERHAAAEKVVAVDRMAAAAVSGDTPPGLQQYGMNNEDALRTVMETNMSITTGLGVSYAPSQIVSARITATTLDPGTRLPDCRLSSVGMLASVRVYDVVNRQRSAGQWSILIFAGDHQCTKSRFMVLRERVDAKTASTCKIRNCAGVHTICLSLTYHPWSLFDGPPLGRLYYDGEGVAHSKFGVYSQAGAIVVVRPDGIFAHAAALDEWDHIESFFGNILG